VLDDGPALDRTKTSSSITSSAFKDGEIASRRRMPATTPKNPNCIGEKRVAPLAFSKPAAGTKSYALLMVDPEGRQAWA